MSEVGKLAMALALMAGIAMIAIVIADYSKSPRERCLERFDVSKTEQAREFCSILEN